MSIEFSASVQFSYLNDSEARPGEHGLMTDLGNTTVKQENFFAGVSWSVMGRERQYLEKQKSDTEQK